MGLISGVMLGMVFGVALMAGWHRMMQHRSTKRTAKAADIKVLASLGREELKKICGDSFPEWISFPVFEQVKWLNKQLSKLWPFVADAAELVIRESVEPLLEQYRPTGISSLKFNKLTLGTVAPKIEGIRVQSLQKGQIIMDIDLRWGGDPNIILGVEAAVVASIPILCLVKGCHKRLRIVHTIEFSNGGADIQILRVAVYEEQWVGPANIDEHSEVELDMKPFSQRKRTRASELTGPWKVFEMSATPIYGDDMATLEGDGPPYVYLCMETMKKRSLPESTAYFGEEEMVDLQDVTVLWLPGGVTSYVDVSKDGILCIGVGWYSDEGIDLVMERDYETDGKLREVRSKFELKRRWSDPTSS